MKIVFLTYLNRSGSTYLANLLSSSKDVCACPESDALVRLFLEAPAARFALTSRTRRKLSESFSRDEKMAAWDLVNGMWTCLENARTNLEAFVSVLNYYSNSVKPRVKIILFKAERLSALMEKIFKANLENPEIDMCFLSIIRDPRAVVSSQLKTLIPGKSTPMCHNPVRTSLQWRSSVKQVMRYNEISENVMIINYEDLITKPGVSNKELSGFLGIDHTELNPGKGDLVGKLSDETRHVHQRANLPPQQDRVNAWRENLDLRNIYLIERTCRSWMDKFNYPLKSGKIRPIIEIARICQVALFYMRNLLQKVWFQIGAWK
jgi:hypothetical protein